MSIRSDGFPCSNFRTKHRPTPDFMARSSCVRPFSLRNVFTTTDNSVFFMQNYIISNANIHKNYHFISFLIYFFGKNSFYIVSHIVFEFMALKC